MLNAITTLLLFQLIGEALSQVFSLPIPGPVVGMALLFLTLIARVRVAQQLRETAQNMLQHLSLLFVPAGVGVMLHVRRVADEWLAIAVALVLSTVITVAATAFTIQLVARLVRSFDNQETSR